MGGQGRGAGFFPEIPGGVFGRGLGFHGSFPYPTGLVTAQGLPRPPLWNHLFLPLCSGMALTPLGSLLHPHIPLSHDVKGKGRSRQRGLASSRRDHWSALCLSLS